MIDIHSILKEHAEWFLDNSKGKRADLSEADLSGVDLSGADLSGADLSGADLSGANLVGADLSGANLFRANLFRANLFRANLFRANLFRANLVGADLSGADLSEADLSKKEWQQLGNKFAIVTSDTKYVYKKLNNNLIAYLEIPKKAKRSNSFSRKCRAEYVKVLKILNENGKEVKEGYSYYDNTFKYKKGRTVRSKLPFDDNWYNECGSGIHFFITEQEAKEFVW